MKKTLISIFIYLIFTQINFVNAFIGEKTDIDLYKKIDSSVLNLKSQMIQNDLKGSSYTINNALQKNLKVRYLDENSDFDFSDLNMIINGNISPIFRHIKDVYLNDDESLSTNILTEIHKIIINWYISKNINAENNISNMHNLGSIGLYYDGDTQNSGYDLMYDLEQINKVIFSKDIDYNGSLHSNKTSDLLSNILNNPLKDDEDIPIGSSGSYNQIIVNNDTASGTIGVNSLNGNISNTCLTGNLLNTSDNSSLSGDDKLLTDLKNQLISGSNNNSSIGGQSSQDGADEIMKDGVGNGSSLLDAFPCNSIFCINIDFVMYKQNLLGGKTYSIEGILNKNYKIIDKIAATPLLQSEMTNTSFSLSVLKKLNLGNMIHLGIIVGTLPIPILSLSKNNADLGIKGDFTDEQLYIGNFSEVGLDYKNQNDLSKDFEKHTMVNCAKLDTNSCQMKLLQIDSNFSAPEPFSATIYSSLKNNYMGNLNKDMMSLMNFSKTLGSKINMITILAKSLKAKNCN